jgi:hypothetical protein
MESSRSLTIEKMRAKQASDNNNMKKTTENESTCFASRPLICWAARYGKMTT